MKHTFFLVVLAGLLTAGLSALDLRVGPVSSVVRTTAFEAVVEGPIDWFGEGFRPEMGLEAGVAVGTPQVLVPLGLMWEGYAEKGWSFGAAVHGLLGSSFGSAPGFLWGGEAELRTEWSWSPGIALGLAAGVRYSDAVWEVPFHLICEFGLGTDTLEPAGSRDKE